MGGPTVHFARVSPNGTLLAGDATGVNHRSDGVFDVTFGVDVSGCSYQVTLQPLGFGGAAYAWVSAAADAHSVRVMSFSKDGASVDGPFYLTVSCLS
jgi:hypothetical protein